MTSFRSLGCLVSLLASAGVLNATQLKVNSGGRYLETVDGEPFFWMADTAWEMTNRLNLEEIETYLDNRAAKGFTVIFTNVLSHWAIQRPNVNGDLPFVGTDPGQRVEAYFEYLDAIVALIAKKGFVIGLLPTWGDKFYQLHGAGPEIFTPENAREYGRFLGERYAEAPIVWVLGGDRVPQNERHYAIIDAMAAGLRDAVGNRQLITYHPWGGQGSDNFFHDREWLDFNLIQSGHHGPDLLNFKLIERAYARTPVKPIIESEPCYEDHPVNFKGIHGWFTDFEPRRAAYWAILSGSPGTTYGHNGIWQFYKEGETPIADARVDWKTALNYPGAYQMTIVRKIFTSLPWWRLEPKSSWLRNYVDNPPATPLLAVDPVEKHVVVYSPYGLSFSINLSEFKDQAYSASWIDPRTGHAISAGAFTAGSDLIDFDPPFDPARGNDWLLLLKPVDR